MKAKTRMSARSALALALSASMTLTLATACSSDKGSKDAGGATKAPDSTAAATAPGAKSYDKKLKISIASLTELKDNAMQNEFHKFWTDKFNLEWEYNYVPWDSWNEKLRLWINSNDLPDIATYNYVHGDVMNYIDQGLLYKLPDDWKTRWPNVAAAYKLTGLGDQLEKLTKGTYVLPRPVYFENKPADPLVNQIGVVALRKDWAEAVGFELKNTYKASELMEFARLLKQKDPGKVGDKLIPIAYNPGDALTNIVMANSASSRVESAFYKDTDGKYKWGPASNETLTGLKLFQQAYKEGLLYPEFYTWKNNDAGEKFSVNGVAGVMSLGGLASYRQEVDKKFRENLKLDSLSTVHTAIVVGEDGKYRNLEQANFWSAIIFSPKISKEKFERVMDFLDFSTSKDGQMLVNMGFKDKDWKYGANGELVSLLQEGETMEKKYPGRFEGFYVLSDDFSIVNPAIKKEFRDRSVQHFKDKAALGQQGGALAKFDWDFQLFNSKAKNQASFDYATEYAGLIMQAGDLEANWKKWVDSKTSLVQPVLNELNNLKK